MSFRILTILFCIGITLGNANTNADDSDTASWMLPQAIQDNDLTRVRRLLSDMGNLAVIYTDGQSLTHIASYYGSTEIVREVLDKYHMQINAVDRCGYTPLFFAVKRNNLEVVRFLVGRGANVNAVSRRGHTPLDLALQENYVEIAKFLVVRGAIKGQR